MLGLLEVTQMSEKLKLKNQLCHRLYVASNAVIRAYRPLLSELDITYPQYLVMLVLWENDHQEVGKIRDLTQIDGGALTLILKKLKEKGYLELVSHNNDKRIKVVKLTEQGNSLKAKAVNVPESLRCMFSDYPDEDIDVLKSNIDKLLLVLNSES